MSSCVIAKSEQIGDLGDVIVTGFPVRSFFPRSGQVYAYMNMNRGLAREHGWLTTWYKSVKSVDEYGTFK